jgi:hypothetical protein
MPKARFLLRSNKQAVAPYAGFCSKLIVSDLIYGIYVYQWLDSEINEANIKFNPSKNLIFYSHE